MAVSLAAEPLSTKKKRSSPGGVTRARRAASSIPAGWAKPKNDVLNASWRIWLVMASTMSCRPCPQLTFHREARPSMNARPLASYR